MEKIEGNYLTQANKDFPLDCETLAYIAQNCSMSEMLGNIGGDKLILYGCALKAGTTSEYESGYVFIRTAKNPHGEVMPFAGGDVSDGVHVQTEDIAITADDRSYPKAYTKRYLAAGSGDEQYSWGDFTVIDDVSNTQLKALYDDLKDTVDAIVGEPYGIVKMWSGSATVPDGYHLCDGSSLKTTDYPKLFAALGYTFGGSGTTFRLPNLQGRFIVGESSSDNDFSKGNTGGEKTHALTIDEIPSHSHTASFSASASDDGNVGGYIPTANDQPCTNNAKITISSAGGGQAHNNLPPYFVLAYIMKLG